jgi:hypothetical protein
MNWSKSIFLGVFHIGALTSLFCWSWPAVISGVPARAIKRVRFNPAATMWQLVSGDSKNERLSYEGA